MKELGYSGFHSKIKVTGIKSGDFTVVYGVIDTMAESDWPGSLPFFSQVVLRDTHRSLKRMGYNAALARIGLDTSIVTKKEFDNHLDKRKKKKKTIRT